MLSERERDKYQKVWRNPVYRLRNHGAELWGSRQDLIPPGITSALDIGCGLGTMLPIWSDCNIDGHGVDISVAAIEPEIRIAYASKLHFCCLWHMDLGRRFDFGLCSDVMEHIPRERVQLTLNRIFDHCDNVLFKIAHEHSSLDGETLHLTREPQEWWVEMMNSESGSAVFKGTIMRSGQLDSLISWSK